MQLHSIPVPCFDPQGSMGRCPGRQKSFGPWKHAATRSCDPALTKSTCLRLRQLALKRRNLKTWMMQPGAAALFSMRGCFHDRADARVFEHDRMAFELDITRQCDKQLET